MQNELIEQNALLEGEITKTISPDGYEFDYLNDYWKLNRNITINVDFLHDLDEKVSERVREALIHYAETQSAAHADNISKNIRLYLTVNQENSFTEFGLIAFKNYLYKEKEYKLGVLRGFLRTMRYLGLSDCFDDGIFELLNKWRLKGNEKGQAILSLDPMEGPFSDMEFEAIGHNAAHSYSEGRLSLKAYALILLFKATGRRREQIAQLKVKDFAYTNALTGSPVYVVQIPRIKQRNVRYRSQFRPFGLVDSIAKVIELHISDVIKRVEEKTGCVLTSSERGELPVFYQNDMVEDIKRFSGNDRLDYLSSLLPHARASMVAENLVSAVECLEVVSERTGELLHVYSTRFRYTLGTRAAQQGSGVLTIANLLDHSDTQNANVYVKNVPEYAVEISKIMNQPLVRFASAFAGRIVKDEDEANAENQGATRISCHEEDCDVGSCGSNSFCQDYAPVACYLCPKFRPWVNAPHHLILKFLMEERERLKPITNDMQVVAINDRAIIAVCQVIKAIKESRNNE